MSSRRVIQRIGDQVYVEYEDRYTGELIQEWESDPIRMCACNKRPASDCSLIQETTFTETYSCGFVYRYANNNGYDDNLISVKGKRVK